MKWIFSIISIIVAALTSLCFAACRKQNPPAPVEQPVTSDVSVVQTEEPQTEEPSTEEPPTDSTEPTDPEPMTTETDPTVDPAVEEISFDLGWTYADYSAIHTDSVKLYRSQAETRKGKVVCVNAGHGCRGGSSQYTLCHPDGSPKVTGGSTAAGAVQATSINEGTVLLDGTPEADATLALALQIKARLLADGYDVLMIRETKDAQLDNIARTVIANNRADCHISLHYDSSQNDKGLFFIGVPNVASYRNMEPVKSHFEEHTALGEALLSGARAAGVKIYSSGRVDIDLTQTSYSTVPSVDLEVGDRASDHSTAQLDKIAAGISAGLDQFFGV